MLERLEYKRHKGVLPNGGKSVTTFGQDPTNLHWALSCWSRSHLFTVATNYTRITFSEAARTFAIAPLTATLESPILLEPAEICSHLLQPATTRVT